MSSTARPIIYSVDLRSDKVTAGIENFIEKSNVELEDTDNVDFTTKFTTPAFLGGADARER